MPMHTALHAVGEAVRTLCAAPKAFLYAPIHSPAHLTLCGTVHERSGSAWLRIPCMGGVAQCSRNPGSGTRSGPKAQGGHGQLGGSQHMATYVFCDSSKSVALAPGVMYGKRGVRGIPVQPTAGTCLLVGLFSSIPCIVVMRVNGCSVQDAPPLAM